MNQATMCKPIAKASHAEERWLALHRFQSQRKQRARRGVSMLELIITISIVAVLGMIAVPKFNETRTRHRNENTARVIHQATSYAVSEARRRTATVTITFNANNELLTISAHANAQTVDLPWRGRIAGARNQGSAIVAWSIIVDPHGRVDLDQVPSDSNLSAMLSATATTGTGISRGRQ